MPETFDSRHYLELVEYDEIVETVRDFSALLIFEFASHPPNVRDRIIRNFVARGAITLQSIQRLYHLSHYSDCWALFRSLTDRYFHLHALAENDEFEVFEEWSFVKQYEAQNRALSDPEFGPTLNKALAEPSAEQKLRYSALKAKKPRWTRPNAEEVAKSLDLTFLYRFGYDYSSTQVHPMANDGEMEFFLLTGLKSISPEMDQRVLLNNSILIHSLLLQKALNVSTFRWRSLIYDFVEQVREALSGNLMPYRLTFIKIAQAGHEFRWSE